MSYLYSADIRVFPLGQTRTIDSFKDDRYLSERNLTQMLSRFVDEESYVLRYTKKSGSEDNSSLEFVVKGYYINWLKVDTALDSTFDCVYANIVFDGEAMKGDNNTVFEGVDIRYKSKTETAPPRYLLLLVKNDDNVTWEIPAASKFKHSGESLFLTKTADDGETKIKVSVQDYVDAYLDNVFGEDYDSSTPSTIGGTVGSYINAAFGDDYDPNDASSSVGGTVGSAVTAAVDSLTDKQTLYFSETDSDDDGYADGLFVSKLQKYFGTGNTEDDTPDPEYKTKGLIEQKLDEEISAYTLRLQWKTYT